MQEQQSRPGAGVGGYIPTEDQVRLLVGMGFRSDESRAALVTSNGQIHQAIQLLTTNQQHRL